jgi:Ca2+-transporting ATPase
MTDWYQKEATEVASILATDTQAGLAEAEAQRRLAEHGPNQLIERGPKSPWRILWVNLVTDGLPGLALTLEPSERDTMRRPPHAPGESIFGRRMGWDVLWVGLLMGLVSLGLGYWAWTSGRATWQTMVFTTLALSQMGNALDIRSERDSLFRLGLLSNKPLLATVLLTLFLQLAVVYVPALQRIFKIVALPPADLAISLIMSSVVFSGR